MTSPVIEQKQDYSEISIDEALAQAAQYSCIAIYGFADVGKLIFTQVRSGSDSGTNIAVFDKNASDLNKAQSLVKVREPEDIASNDIEHIFITTQRYAREIADMVLQHSNLCGEQIKIVVANPLTEALGDSHSNEWIDGAVEEVQFWESRIGSRSLFPNMCEQRANPEKAFFAALTNYFPEHTRIDVLDVGSGPVTTLGYKSVGKDINLVMTDPLADHYHRLYEKYSFHPPVKPIRCAGEELLQQFPKSSFDLIYSCNALDHSENPEVILTNMGELLREGGVLYVTVLVNEGEFNNYSGLHKWNFEPRDESLILWQPGTEINLNKSLAAVGDVHILNCNTQTRQLTFHVVKNK